jgi:UDP-N-acetylmuramoyl-L-alanyl-D-glutamate--2,6-diaminopimelate ligase
LHLTDLLYKLVPLPADVATTDISGLAVNSAKVKKGDLFFALAGKTFDGRDFIDDAIKRGAAAVVTDKRPLSPKQAISVPVVQIESPRQVMAKAAARFWPQQPGLIGAVTGTNGKTSTVDFMRQIWARANWSSISIGTIGMRGDSVNRADTPMTNITQLTTPDSLNLHASIDSVAKQGVTHLAVEASSHGLQQHRLDGLNIHVAGFTNLSRDHLDHHPSMDDYFAAKLRLFEDLLIEGGAAVINIDDAYGKKNC